MMKAILFDLDDTLLGNDIEQFLPHYFGLLGRYAAERYDPQMFIQILLGGTEAMIQGSASAETNRDIFWQYFTSKTGNDAADAEVFFDTFYRTQFDKLQAQTTQLPAARPLVDHCFAQGLKIVVATNPLFPRAAIEARLRWAGIDASQFDYDLVTTYENMHATKPTTAYYEEILAHIGVAPEAALMVGDSWENDIEPARALGMAAYWMDLGRELPQPNMLVGHGSLDDFWQAVQAGLLANLGAI